MRRPARIPNWALLLAAGGLVTASAAVVFAPRPPADAAAYRPSTVSVPAGVFSHRVHGEYLRVDQPVDAPKVETRIATPIEIMSYQVTRAEYARCVADRACQRADQGEGGDTLPATGVSYTDAMAYAVWLSEKTGETWRLPDDAEWARAAGSRFVDDARGYDPDERNPAKRWLADYEREAANKAATPPRLRPAGSFGANEHGVHDMAGNVWEWTRTCHRRVTLDAAGREVRENVTCGVYVTEGRHRAPMTLFVRNPKSGGCSVATPPDHLGFRLVREATWSRQVAAALRNRLRI